MVIKYNTSLRRFNSVQQRSERNLAKMSKMGPMLNIKISDFYQHLNFN